MHARVIFVKSFDNVLGMLEKLSLAFLTKPHLLTTPLLAAASITQSGNMALGIILFIGGIMLIGGILAAAVMGMMGRDMNHIKVSLICAAVGGLAVAIVAGMMTAGGTPMNYAPQQPN